MSHKRLRLRRELRRQFWLQIRAGLPRKKAALAVGLNEDTGKEWFRQAGGVIPAYVTAAVSGRYLSLNERKEIFAGVERGDSIRLIARSLGRAPSTVLRELRRNMQQQYRPRSGPPGAAGKQPWD